MLNSEERILDGVESEFVVRPEEADEIHAVDNLGRPQRDGGKVREAPHNPRALRFTSRHTLQSSSSFHGNIDSLHQHIPIHRQTSHTDDLIARSPSHDSFAQTNISLLSLSSVGSDVNRTARSSGWSSCAQSFSVDEPVPPQLQSATQNAMANSNPNVSRPNSCDVLLIPQLSMEDIGAPSIHIHDISPTPNARCSPLNALAMNQPFGHSASGGGSGHNRSARNSLLQVPGECYGSRRHETLFEEESDVIRNCSALSSAVLGLMKSFSTGDISSDMIESSEPLRATVSEEALCAWDRLEVPTAGRRLDCASRSCSTWVAVGDIQSSTSQLPSPSARCGSGNIPGFTAADLVCSVNKKVRQMYIRRRLMSTYKALERLTKSQLNLSDALLGDIQVTGPSDLKRNLQNEIRLTSSVTIASDRRTSDGCKTPLTAKDVERDRGKALTKYERNMMIFNWLHNLDEDEESLNAAAPNVAAANQTQTLQAA